MARRRRWAGLPATLLLACLPAAAFAQCNVAGSGNSQRYDTLGGACVAISAATTVITVGPSQRTLVALDVTTVTTGGTAVTALTAGHRTAGGFIQNPPSATVNLCLNELGTASGTTSAGSTTCILPGQSYSLAAAAGAVSVISSDSAHPFAGYGMQ